MNSNLEKANLQRCRVFGCNFTGANLKDANLNDTEVDGADFTNCKLQGSIMTSKGLEKAIFKNAIYNDATIWPLAFDPKKLSELKRQEKTNSSFV